MARAKQSLAEEAQAALQPTWTPAAPPGALLLDRRRLLPFMVVGAAVLGVTVGVIGGNVRGGDANRALASGAFGGIAIGMAIGWVVLGLGNRVIGGRPIAPTALLLIRTLLSVPPYLTAGIGAAMIGHAVTGAAGPGAEVARSAVTALAWGAIVIFPLSLAMGRSRQGPVLAATTLRGAIDETINESSSGSPFGRMLGFAVIVVLWLIGSIFGVLSMLVFLKSFDPARYTAAFEAHGSLIGSLTLVAISGIIVGGSMVSIRVVFGRRSTSQPRRHRRRG